MTRKFRIWLYIIVGLGVFIPSWIIFGDVKEIIAFPILIIVLATIVEIKLRHKS